MKFRKLQLVPFLLMIFMIKNSFGQNKAVTFSNHPDWNFTVSMRAKLEIEPCVTKMPVKLFMISDVEGEFEGFRNLLISNKVMDEKYNWTFGKGHMVICGDLFDRGNEVPECLWLIYKLEQKPKLRAVMYIRYWVIMTS